MAEAPDSEQLDFPLGSGFVFMETLLAQLAMWRIPPEGRSLLH
jgi:hypothetical protein